jgi:O-methyltransferase involved in polyketide biosynthesis
VIANLEEAGCLSHGLKKQGFDTCAATAWVIEGLLYYLKPESVPNLLQVGSKLLRVLIIAGSTAQNDFPLQSTANATTVSPL